MADIFVSHASDDDAVAVTVVTALRAEGHRVFHDTDRRDGIAPGEHWRKALFHELRLCEAVVFLHSENADKSSWCHTELAVAIELSKRIYPLDLSRDLTPNPVTTDLQSIRLQSTLEASIGRLIEGLSRDGLSDRIGPRWDIRRPPYPGLAAMDIQDADVFFGRDRELSNLMARVEGPLGRHDGDVVVVTGASGCGKSSLVRAGLAARLSSPQSRWVVLEPFEPGIQPLERLMTRMAAASQGRLSVGDCKDRLLEVGLAALANLLADVVEPRASRILITIDQVEQLVTLTPPAERERFQTALESGLVPGSGITVVMTVRLDRYDQIQRLPALGPAIEDPVILNPMDRAQLSSVIERPALRADLHIDGALVIRLIDDAMRGGGEAVDALPLLAFTLREIYDLVLAENRQAMTETDYDRVGSIDGAIARRAQAAESGLPAETGPELETLLARLVTLSDDRLPTGRPLARSQLTATEQEIVSRLEDERLLVGTHDTVRLAHERLIGAWPRLTQAVTDRREDLLLRARLEREAEDWKYGGGPLLGRDSARQASAWVAGHSADDESGGLVRAYVESSQATLRRRRRVAVTALSTIVALALVAGVVAAIAVRRNTQLSAETRYAQSAELGAEAVNLYSTNTPVAMLLSLEADHLGSSPLSQEALSMAAQQPIPALLNTGASVNDVAISPDGETIAIAEGNKVLVWNWQNDAQGSWTSSAPANEVAFSSKSLLAVATGLPDTPDKPDNASKIAILNIGSLSQRGHISINTEGKPLPAPSHVNSIAFNPADGSLAAGGDDYVTTWIPCHSGVNVRLCQGTQYPLQTDGQGTTTGGQDTSWSANVVAFGPHGGRLAIGGSSGYYSIVNWTEFEGISDPDLLSHPHQLSDSSPISALAIRPPGRTTNSQTDSLVLGDAAGAITSIDPSSDPPSYEVLDQEHLPAAINSLAFTSDGKDLLSGDDYGLVTTWISVQASGSHLSDAWKELGSWSSGSAVNSIADNGSIDVCGNDTGQVILWKTQGWKQILAPPEGPPFGTPLSSLAYDPNSALLVGADESGQIDVGKGAQWSNVAWSSPVVPNVDAMGFSPNDAYFAAGTSSGYLAIATAPAVMHGSILKFLLGPSGQVPINSLSFSPDGSTLALAIGLENSDGPGELTIEDAVNQSPLAFEPIGDPVTAVAFGQGGLIATGDDRGQLRFYSWDASKSRLTVESVTLPQPLESPVTDIAFSPDGRSVVFDDDSGQVAVWNLQTHRETSWRDPGPIESLALSPSGGTLATGDANGDVVIRDIDSGKMIMWSEGSPVESLAFLYSDGSAVATASGGNRSPQPMLATGDADGQVNLYSSFAWAGPRDIRQGVCSELNDLNMTQEQWQTYVKGDPYWRTC